MSSWHRLTTLGLVAALSLLPCLAAVAADRPVLGRHIVGVNYIKLDPVSGYHTLFSTFDFARVDKDLADIAANGFDVVRVFVEARSYPERAGSVQPQDPVSDNVRSFLDLAAKHHLNVILVFDVWIPPGYVKLLADDKTLPVPLRDAKGVNQNAFLFDDRLVQAHAESIADLVRALYPPGDANGRLPPSLLGIDIRNEMAFYIDRAPIADLVAHAGQDAGKGATAVEQVADDAVDKYIDTHERALRAAGYGGLITMSVFPPAAIGSFRGDEYVVPRAGIETRRPVSASNLRRHSGLDFVSLNLYPGPHDPNRSMGALLQSSGLFSPSCKCGSKPVLVTETGELRDFFAGMDDDSRLRSFAEAIKQACRADVAGWLYWAWGSDTPSPKWLPLQTDGRMLAVLGDLRC